MKKITISILFVVLGGVACMAIPQAQTSIPFEQNNINQKRANQPFEQNDIPEVGTKQIKQNEKIWNQEYREYQRKVVKQPVDVKTTDPKVKLKEGESYSVVGETASTEQTPKTTISQGTDAQFFHRYGRNESADVAVESFQKPLKVNQSSSSDATDDGDEVVIETGQIQNVGYDSNPNEGWNEQVKDEPIGDCILPLILLTLLYIKIKSRK